MDPSATDTIDVPIATNVDPIMPNLSDEEETVEAMMPILDSIVRTMCIGDTAAYQPQDPEFFWNMLYLMGVNWGHTHPLVEQTEEYVKVPRQVMQEFASAAFLDYSDLLPVPESMAGSLWYDEGLDAYCLAYSDKGDTETKLESVAAGADGSITAVVNLYETPDTFLNMVEFVLVANPYVDGISEPTYFYTVRSATLAVMEG
ncbi:hypothetical protein SDC9_132455 [bioreactor metagenome]|uniref:Uncharacterized protein n=1 Tax=bioreactor metagenome TaxID=1076179 RepID=A0A645D839_9ZZZZ